MNKRLILILFTLLFTGNVFATECCNFQAFNKDGSVVTGVIAPVYDPGVGEYPLPINLAFLGTDDFTLNLPAADPTDFGDPFVALGALDGFSTTEKWIMEFASVPHALDGSTIIPGQTVRMFEVSTIFGTIVAVSGVVRELTPVAEFVAFASGNNVAIIPTSPLKEMTTYMVVMTNDIKDTAGNDATPSDRYYATKGLEPLVDAEGHSTYSLLDDASAQALESLRQIHTAQEAAVAPLGIDREDIILSWTAQTQSITPVLKNIRSIAKPAPTVVGPTGMNTAMVGGLGAADIYAGIITIPYYLGVPSAEKPTAPLTDFWTASPGAYVAPFDTLGLNPTSTHVTVANPFPVVTSMQTVPLLMTVPNANSGHTKPAAGWPVVVYGHGITRSRADILTMADSAAAAGYAVVAIDMPLHGISPDDPVFGDLHISKTPFAGMGANERTFDVDYVNNTTSAPGSDGVIDGSGTHIINLSSMLTSRDNFRQGEVDLSVLTVTIPSISYDGDALPDLDGSTIQFVGQSMGSMMGTAFVAIEPMIKNALLSVPMGGIPRALEASPAFGPRIRAGLKAAAGIEPGMADYEQFFIVFQTVTDSGDPINWSAEAAHYNNILLWEVWGDQTNPNYVATAPLSGTEPMIRAMGLTAYSSTTQNANGLDLVGRFVPPAEHSTFLSPLVGSAEAYIEMQKQMASFIGSKGTAVVVENAATMMPEVGQGMVAPPVSDLRESRKSKKAKGGQNSRLEGSQQAIPGLSFFPGKITVSGFEHGARSEPGDGRQLQEPERFK